MIRIDLIATMNLFTYLLNRWRNMKFWCKDSPSSSIMSEEDILIGFTINGVKETDYVLTMNRYKRSIDFVTSAVVTVYCSCYSSSQGDKIRDVEIYNGEEIHVTKVFWKIISNIREILCDDYDSRECPLDHFSPRIAGRLDFSSCPFAVRIYDANKIKIGVTNNDFGIGYYIE